MICRLLMLLVCFGCLSLPALAGGQAFTFETITVPFPGAKETMVTGVNADTVVGSYVDAEGHVSGWLRRGGDFHPLPLFFPRGLNAAGHLIGRFQLRGFLLRLGSLRLLAGPTAVPTYAEALGLNTAGHVVGHFATDAGMIHGFIYDAASATYTVVGPPDAQGVSLTAVNTAGVAVGSLTPAGRQPRQPIRVEAGTVTPLVLPAELAKPFLVAIGDDETLAGNNWPHAFVLQGGVVQTIAVPQAQYTELAGRRDDGVLYGRFFDAAGVQHGFIATPTPPR